MFGNEDLKDVRFVSNVPDLSGLGKNQHFDIFRQLNC